MVTSVFVFMLYVHQTAENIAVLLGYWVQLIWVERGVTSIIMWVNKKNKLRLLGKCWTDAFSVVKVICLKYTSLVVHNKSYGEVCGDLISFCSSCTDLFTIKLDSFYCINTCTDIFFHSKYEFQICEYHKKEKLLANRMIPNEAQYTKDPFVISTIKEHNTFPMEHFDDSNRFIHISWPVCIIPHSLLDSFSLFLSDSNKP